MYKCYEYVQLSFTELCHDETEHNLRQVPHPPPSPPLANMVRHDSHATSGGLATIAGSSMYCGAQPR